jgi:putative transposase
MKGEWSVRALCALIGVARSGYYRWCRQPVSARRREDQVLGLEIGWAHRAARGLYGAPRLVAELRAHGRHLSRRRCARLMREQGLRGRCWRRRVRTTQSRPGPEPVANALREHPAPTGPNQIWVTDLTYVRTLEGWLFLAAVLDAWSRRVVGWACARTLHTDLARRALATALADRGPRPGLLHHSDRGCQYTDQAYRHQLQVAGIRQSLSRPGCCYDNAAMEAFWSTLKL